MYWGAGRKCRYSGARRAIGSIRRHWGLLGCRDVGAIRGGQGVSGLYGGWQGV